MPCPATATLHEKLRRGKISVQDFMAFCLSDDNFGSYKTRNPINNDFTTAPEISQMFGEIIGLVYVDFCLNNLPVNWIELGAGSGTLTADAMRAASKFLSYNPDIHLVEHSPVLRLVQAEKLASYQPIWHNVVDTLPTDKPLFIVANEFFDALPIQQFVLNNDVWQHRYVTLIDDKLQFDSFGDTIKEYPKIGLAIFDTLCRHLITCGGKMIIIDYGTEKIGYGDTIQAVYQNKKVDVFSHIGQADLSSHVQFGIYIDHAKNNYPQLSVNLTTQGQFLHDNGILSRLNTLIRHNPDNTKMPYDAYHRLTHPTQMGSLFRVLTVG